MTSNYTQPPPTLQTTAQHIRQQAEAQVMEIREQMATLDTWKQGASWQEREEIQQGLSALLKQIDDITRQAQLEILNLEKQEGIN